VLARSGLTRVPADKLSFIWLFVAIQGYRKDAPRWVSHASRSRRRYERLSVVEEGSQFHSVSVLTSEAAVVSAGSKSDLSRREENALSLTDSHPALSPSNVYTYLANLFYARRSKMNPVWNAVLVGGWDTVKNERYVIVLSRRFRLIGQPNQTV
jgi:hypothetical protein